MLSKKYEQIYQNFEEILKKLLNLSTTESTPEALLAACEQAQEFFRQQIAGLVWDESDRPMATTWQSIHTEMHKEMRLLVTETTFYQITRSETIKNQRKEKIGDRAQTLVSYCHVLLTSSQP